MKPIERLTGARMTWDAMQSESEPPVAGSVKNLESSAKYKFNWNIDTRIFKSGIVEMELRSATATLTRWVMDTRDEATRKALIALGWTPPNAPGEPSAREKE